MATTKTINTRIQLRYDTLTNWQSEATAGKGALLVLNKGEMALCYVPAITTDTTQTAPTVLFKVGDGTKTFRDLPWGGAVAADVYAWAKTPEKPVYKASEISGLADYISGAMHFKGIEESLPATTAGYGAGDVIIVGNKEYVCGSDKVWHELGDETIYAIKGEIVNADIKANAAIDQSKINGLTEALAAKATPADITTEIEKLDAAEKGGASKYIQSISQTNGIITAVEAGMPTTLKNPNALTFGSKTYDGSAEATITATDLGAATTSQLLNKQDMNIVFDEIATTVEDVLKDLDGRISTAQTTANSKCTLAEAKTAATKIVESHAGIDKVGTVTSVATGAGLKVTGTASVNPTVEIDDAVIFILNGGSATTVIE